MPCEIQFFREPAPSVVNKVKRIVARFKTITGVKEELEKNFSAKTYTVYEGDNHVALSSKRGLEGFPLEDKRRRILIITDGIEI